MNVIAILEAQRDVYVNNAKITGNPALLGIVREITDAIVKLKAEQP